jgi:hypothetical protein
MTAGTRRPSGARIAGPLSAALAAGAIACLLGIAPAHAAAIGPDGKASVEINTHPLPPAAAPADEYFGHQKLSNLGIRNIIRAFRIEGNSPLALPIQRGRMQAVDSALFDWGEKYPRDPWLSGAVFGFADVLLIKHDVQTDTMAVDLLLRATQRYAGTHYESEAVRELEAIRPVRDVDWSAASGDPPPYAELVEPFKP